MGKAIAALEREFNSLRTGRASTALLENLKVDWGIRLHDPNEAAGRRWIHNARMRNTAVSFTVGDPF